MKKNITLISALLLFNQFIFAQWEKVSNPEAFQSSNCITSHQGKLYVVVNSDVFVSDDNGDSWSKTNSGTIDNGMIPKFLVSTSHNLYGASSKGGMKYDGQTWTADTVGFQSADIQCLFSDDTRIFIARVGNTSLSLYTKLHSENAWTPVTSMPVPHSVFCFYKLNNTYYAITGGYRKVWTSTDGVSFTETAYTIPVETKMAYSAPDAVYIATGDGLYKTTDGTTFTRIDIGFAKHDILGTGINTVYARGNRVYSSVSYTDSVYESTDAGSTWTTISSGDLTNTVTSFVIHNDAVYATQTAWGADANQIIRYGTPSGPTGLTSVAAHAIKIRVYPNPASTEVVVDTNEPADIRLFNLSGTLQLQTTGKHIDVSNLVPGIYVLQVTTHDGTSTQKLSVE